jgi:hypothetical protein
VGVGGIFLSEMGIAFYGDGGSCSSPRFSDTLPSCNTRQ